MTKSWFSDSIKCKEIMCNYKQSLLSISWIKPNQEILKKILMEIDIKVNALETKTTDKPEKPEDNNSIEKLGMTSKSKTGFFMEKTQQKLKRIAGIKSKNLNGNEQRSCLGIIGATNKRDYG
jgi:hypothetical protein